MAGDTGSHYFLVISHMPRNRFPCFKQTLLNGWFW